MGVAWLDEDAPATHATVLRTGGLPCLDDEQEWPECPRCDLPMLFRAQMPLAVTALVAPSDERVVLFFECHALREGGQRHCDGSALLVAKATAKPREAPAARAFDVFVDAGDRADAVFALAKSFVDEGQDLDRASLPGLLLFAQPRSIAEQAKHVLEGAGARVELRPAAPVTLESARGGILIPFDDGLAGVSKTTLPPLTAIAQTIGNHSMRGLIAGATPGHRDVPQRCACGKPTRTLVRLLGSGTADRDRVVLGPAIAQVCLACGTGSLHRSGAA